MALCAVGFLIISAALNLGISLYSEEKGKEVLVGADNALESKGTGMVVKTRPASTQLVAVDVPQDKCRRLIATDVEVCNTYAPSTKRRLTSSEEEASFGNYDERAVATLLDSVGSTVQIKAENGDIESFEVHSLKNSGSDVIINGGEWVLIHSHDCDTDANAEDALEMDNNVRRTTKQEYVVERTFQLCELGREVKENNLDLAKCEELSAFTPDQCQLGWNYENSEQKLEILDGMFVIDGQPHSLFPW
eukprot:CAMPEP_0183737274 /NCGR_PEP_ID=MMETSP0737-20130205/51473_1 /TAXON_ID=385413 /ORGANISM="Thalassiosira miniscula, Strain CCMP1093" /LENGTH=247 /DNA_ID=CAMNT_0025971509 /DNA_START=12 /DNA_END=752 /DNA_ORIENTATION=-